MRWPGARRASVRDGGTTLTVVNSGLEVWLYDDANREAIRGGDASDPGFGGMPPGFAKATREGFVVGYSMYQDDDVSIEVHVGPALTEDELSVARWLEPQRAFLRLPSGRLCIESNDASRIGPEEATDQGALVELPPWRLWPHAISHRSRGARPRRTDLAGRAGSGRADGGRRCRRCGARGNARESRCGRGRLAGRDGGSRGRARAIPDPGVRSGPVVTGVALERVGPTLSDASARAS